MGNRVVARANRVQSVELPQPGDTITAAEWRALIGTLNGALNEVGPTTVISQEWPGENASHAGSIPQDSGEDVPLCSWLIPIVSDQHDQLHARVRAWNSLGLLHDGRVILRSRVTGDEVSVVVGAGVAAADDWTALDPLDIAGIDVASGDAVDSVDVIDLFIESDDPSATVTLLQLAAEVFDLVDSDGLDDLPAAALTSSDVVAYPIGILMASDYRPLSTPVGFGLIEGDAHLRKRANLAVIWSGLNPAYDGPSANDRWMPPHGVLCAHRNAGNGDRRRYGRFDATGGQVERLDAAPADIGSNVVISNAVPGDVFTAIGGGDEGPRPYVVADVAHGADVDIIERAGVARAIQHRTGQPHLGVRGDEAPIRIATYSAWTREPSADACPLPLDPIQVTFGQAVTGDQYARLAEQMTHHLNRRSVRQVHHVVNYAASDGALELDRPAPIDITHRIPWAMSNAGSYALIWIRYQASDLSATLPEIGIEVFDDDTGAPVLATTGFTLTTGNGLGYDGASNDTERWAIREYLTPVRTAGGPGPLWLGGVGGRNVELRLACTNVRLIACSVLELPDDIDVVES
jgi:hypothetical protein